MTTYYVGDNIKLTATFKDPDGTLTDPTTVTLETKDPSGNKTTYTYSLGEITRSSVGVFTKTFAIDEAGLWLYEWQGTGTLAKVENAWFEARAQVIT